MAPGIGPWHWKRRKRAELEAERDELREKIDELEGEIYRVEMGYSERIYHTSEPVDDMTERMRARIEKLEAKRDALQEDIDAL